MATKRKRGDSWHYVVKRAGVLPRPLYLSFDSEEEGDRYVANLERMLAQGVVPREYRLRASALATVAEAIREYQKVVAVAASDAGLLGVVRERIGRDSLAKADAAWAHGWISDLKMRRLAPATIRHHVGALARCFDWLVVRHPESLRANPLRALPRRYAVYSPAERAATEGGRQDVARDRRLEPGEEPRIRAILDGDRPNGRQRALELHEQEALVLLFELALETAMRLREMFSLEWVQVDTQRRTVFLEKTKNGDRRQVPLSTVALGALKRYQDEVGDGVRVFPWWNGDQAELDRVTARLSRQFARVFDAAGCPGLRFHDLRHEATCRLYERTRLSDLQVAKITGHKDPRMLARYANLRASDLADALW